MIKVIIPVSHSDFTSLDTFTDNFIHFGGAPNSEVIFCPTASVTSPTIEASRKIEHCCKSVRIEALDRDPKGGWPQAPNEHFMWLTYRLDDQKNKLPFLWLELDTTIVRPGWDTALDTKYIMECGGHGFLGRIVPTRKYPDPKDRSKVIIDTLDPHMRGVCLYPADFTRAVAGQQKFFKNGPWDIDLRSYMRRDWRNTNMIQDLWRTVNYRREADGRINCDNDPGNVNYGNYSGYVDPEAYLVHGCKDGSLARLVAEAPAVATTATPIIPSLSTETQPAQGAVPITPQPFKPLAPVQDRNSSSREDSEGAADFARALAKSAALKESASPIIEKIRPLLARKKYRLGDLAKDAGITVPAITTLSKTPNSGIRIKGPARWVELTT